MKKYLILLILSILIMPHISAYRTEIYFNALNIQEFYDEFEEENIVSVSYDGIEVTITNHWSKINILIKNTMGRDVTLILNISREYIKPSEIGVIDLDKPKELTIYLYENYTQFEYPLDAHEEFEYSISKLSLLKGEIVKKWHDTWGVHTYTSLNYENESGISIEFPKESVGHEIDIDSISVVYKTDWAPFWTSKNGDSWWSYYPASTSLNKDVSYYLKDMGQDYQVIVSFKNDQSSVIKVYTYESGIVGWAGKGITKMGIEMRQFIIDTWRD